MPVLVINSGSSPIKYRLINPDSGEEIASGLIERIGEETGHTKHEYGEKGREIDGLVPNHTVGMETILNLFEEVGPSLADGSIKTIGHRVVQGGEYFDGSALVDGFIEVRTGRLRPPDSLHNPARLIGIRVIHHLLPNVSHVVIFDVALFQPFPGEVTTYATGREIAEEHEIRRYGVHGTLHQHVSGRVSKILECGDLRQIVLHIDNGALVSAAVNGSVVETSIGLTLLEGLIMGTHIGDIDPTVVFHLARTAGMDIDELNALFNRGSDLKDLIGQNDMRAVRTLAAERDENVIEALAVCVHRIVKYIGVYAAIMGGLDVIIFTAGAGENDVDLGAGVIDRLAGFGVKISANLNTTRPKEPRILSTPDPAVTVLVVPTNEELTIACQAMSLAEWPSIEAGSKLKGKLEPEGKLRLKGGTR